MLIERVPFGVMLVDSIQSGDESGSESVRVEKSLKLEMKCALTCFNCSKQGPEGSPHLLVFHFHVMLIEVWGSLFHSIAPSPRQAAS